ncbi:MAG TPA: hypothetical protein VMU84_09265 [Thermoanaerobaculia bacterium]|nr:hypothetical protein [Thermoanaerobaculia bacterium]
MTLRKTLLAWLLLIPIALHGATAKQNWTKIELTHADGRNAAFDPELLTNFGAELIAEYGSYAIGYAPQQTIASITAYANARNVNVRVRDDLDVLQLPGAAVDARAGIAGAPEEKLVAEYPKDARGLFVLQFTAPIRKEWVAELEQLGWTLSRYIPNNGYLVIGSSDLVASTQKLSYVQWLDFFHPYQKAAFFAGGSELHDHLFELPPGDDGETAIAAIQDAAQGEVEVTRSADDTRVYARMSDAAAEELLRNGMVISVSPRPTGALSDERQIMSLTANVNAAGTQPTNPGQYWSWVLSRCPNCSSMPSTSWKVGLADTGLDNGQQFGGHSDLAGRKYFGGTFYSPPDDPQCGAFLVCDAAGHGTLTSGMAAGNGAYNFTDSLGFNLGSGVVPTAGIFMTKIFRASGSGGIQTDKLFEWARDATNAGVAVQNHSWNQYSLAQAGTYSTISRDYDIAARDSDGSLSAARVPILFTISSGNTNQGNQNLGTKYLTLPGATAKNVLAVGGVENYRPETPPCGDTRADSFRNIMAISRVGTILPNATTPTYLKPDVMAPASQIVSAHTSTLWPNPSVYCLGAFLGHIEYSGAPGTSFSAPVGAGAALIVKRYLGNTPTDISPALTKAVLIAGARSVRGGEDRTHTPTINPIGPVPSQQQGFGRLSFEDILTGAVKPVTFDQSSTRLFTDTGQVFRVRLRAREATKPVKVVLTWTDTAATAFVTNPLVNDLNLEVRRTSNPTQMYAGNRLAVTTEANGEESTAFTTPPALDNINNVEYFRLFMAANDEFEISVKAWQLAGDTDGNAGTFEQDFALAILNADLVNSGSPIAPVLSAQTNPSATQNVNLSWTPASNMMVTRYDILRGTKLSNMAFLTSTTNTSATDSGLTANVTFIYRINAVGPGPGATSNNDVATTINWLTTPTSGSAVLSQQFTELRQGIDYVRFAANLATGTWSQSIAPGVVIRASHMNEMRDQLEQALTTLGAPLPTYQFPDPIAGVSFIHDEDVTDLRAKVH